MVSTKFRGRLCNNLYQYAYIRSVSERNGYDFCIQTENHENSTFKYFEDIFPHLIYNKNLQYKCKCKLQEVNYDFKKELYNISDDCHVDGFFQNHNYFKIDDVRNWFKIYLNKNETDEYDEYMKHFSPD